MISKALFSFTLYRLRLFYNVDTYIPHRYMNNNNNSNNNNMFSFNYKHTPSSQLIRR